MMSEAPDDMTGLAPVIDLRPELPRDLRRRREYLRAVVQFTPSRQRRAAAMAELACMSKMFTVRG